MHIEPGVVATAEISAANVATLGVVGVAALALLHRPRLLLRGHRWAGSLSDSRCAASLR